MAAHSRCSRRSTNGAHCSWYVVSSSAKLAASSAVNPRTARRSASFGRSVVTSYNGDIAFHLQEETSFQFTTKSLVVILGHLKMPQKTAVSAGAIILREIEG